MISTYQRLQRQRDAGEIDGFTLIELLIVIVVLGILAAVVIFALGGITGKSAVASCAADGATVSTALAAFDAQNGTLQSVPGTGTAAAPLPPLTLSTTAVPITATSYSMFYATTTVAGYSTTATNAIGTIAIGTPAWVSAIPTANSVMDGLLSSSSPTYQGPYIQSWPNNTSHYGYVLEWTQTSLAIAAGTGQAYVPANWSAELYIVTGNTYAATTVTGPTGPVYTASSVFNGNLTPAIINNATPLGAVATNPAAATTVLGLYPYSGPASCSKVS